MNAAGRRAVAAVMTMLLLPGVATASSCTSPLQVAWRSDRPPLSYSVQGDLAGLAADYLPLLGEPAATDARPLAAAALTEGQVPAGTQVLLGWPQAQPPPDGWPAGPTWRCHR